MLDYYRNKLPLPKNPESLCKNFTLHEFTLEELGFPSHQEIYQSVKNVENKIGTQGFMINGKESIGYGGFSLVYNPNYKGANPSLYHQTLGDPNLLTASSQEENTLAKSKIYDGKDSYYDTYGFTHRMPIIQEEFGSIFDNIYGAIMRSRVSYLYSSHFKFNNPKQNWHIDEYAWQMIRLIIPVKTSDNFIIRIHGDDALGNHLKNVEFCPELGKAYMWNNRIPHQMAPLEVRDDPRIYVIIGFSPWFNYENGEYIPNDNWGYPIETIVKNNLFLT